MKILTAAMLVDGLQVDQFAGDRTTALDIVFREVVRGLLDKRRGTGGTFRITLEWVSGSASDFNPKPKEDR